MTRTVVCPECGASMPYGRLSCTECGTILASIGGATRQVETSAGDDEPPLLEPDTPEPGPAEPEAPAPEAVEPVGAEREPEPVTYATAEPEPAVEEPVPVPESARAGGIRAGTAAPPILSDWSGPVPPTVPAPAAAPAWTAAPVDPPVPAEPAPAWPGAAPPPLPAAAAEPASRPVAGTYLAPTAAIAQPVAAKPPARAPTRPGEAPLLADLPFDAPDDLPGWLVVAGGALASVSFLLPWATQIVLGGSLDGGYFGRWGLASPSAIILFGLALATFALGLIPNPVPAWLRTGLLPLLLGGLLLGVVWAYVVGPFGPTIGVWTVALGAILFVAGGIAELRPWRVPRHDIDGPSV